MDVSFLFEMGWKSAAIAGAALALAAALRGRPAAERALVLRIGVVLLLALPAVALGLPALRLEIWAAPEQAALLSPETIQALIAAQAAAPVHAAESEGVTMAGLVLIFYLAGLGFAAARLVAGLWTLRRWTAEAVEIRCPRWRSALERLGGGDVRLLASPSPSSPLSWGWRRPTILIDPGTLERPDQARAILAHELAHVERADWPVLMLTRIAGALFWFNPLVRLLEREVEQQAEEAADRAAIAGIEPAAYAETLLSCARGTSGAVPAHGIAPSPRALSRRIRAVLDRNERSGSRGRTALAALVCIGLAAPVAALELAEARAQATIAPHPRQAEIEAAVREVQLAMAQPRTEAAEIEREVRESIAGMPDRAEIQRSVREAMANMPDQAEIRRSVEAALAAMPSRAEMDQAVRAAMVDMPDRAELERVIRESMPDRAELQRSIRSSMPDPAEMRRHIDAAMAHGAVGFAAAADGMEGGARTMEAEAARLRQPAERERIIAREAERGRTVTHSELIEAARGLEEGARRLRESARAMRARTPTS